LSIGWTDCAGAQQSAQDNQDTQSPSAQAPTQDTRSLTVPAKNENAANSGLQANDQNAQNSAAQAEPDASTQQQSDIIPSLQLPKIEDQELVPQKRRPSRAENDSRPRAQTVRQRDHPELDARNISIGGFTLAPSAGVRFGYDGNVFGLTDGPGDAYVVGSVSARLTSNWSRHSLEVDGDFSDRKFATYSTEDGVADRIAAVGRLDILRGYWLSIDLSHQRVLADRSSVTEIDSGRRPTRYDRDQAEMTAHAEAGRFTADLSTAVAQYDYVSDPALAGTPDDTRFRDHHRFDLGAEIGYEISPDRSFFISINRSRRVYRYQAVPSRDATLVEALAGLRSAITPVITGRIALGYISADFDDPAVPDEGGLDVDARLDWMATELTTVHVEASRRLDDAAFASAPARLSTRAEVGIDHELLRNLIVSAEASYDSLDYSLSNRSAKLFQIGLSTAWTPNRFMQFGANIGFRRRDAGNFSVPRSFSALEAGIFATWRL
jgi:hypothetical protein